MSGAGRAPEPERERGDYEYRLRWERPSVALVMAHQEVIWENLTDEEWDGLPWEKDEMAGDEGEVHRRRYTLEFWAEYHYQPIRNVTFDRRLKCDPDADWDETAVRGGTGVTHWKPFDRLRDA